MRWMPCCRRPSAHAAATAAAAPTPRPSSNGTADINQCPPGGAATIAPSPRSLAGRRCRLNPAYGAEGPALVAEIDEAACIGCAKCLPPCPVDAIVGAHKQMHTVLAALCTGCELCVAPCPVDCIRMLPRAPLAGPAPAAADNRVRYAARNARLARQARGARRAPVRAQGATCA